MTTQSSAADVDSAGRFAAGMEIACNHSNLDRIGVELSVKLKRMGLELELTAYDWTGFIERSR